MIACVDVYTCLLARLHAQTDRLVFRLHALTCMFVGKCCEAMHACVGVCVGYVQGA